ncbi:MAG: pyridoxal phosphate-dependent aminotransferase [Paucimonas sp.]|nr:pyridoxal phosphate-dependent aminotransferase [Paucimonas sp.]
MTPHARLIAGSRLPEVGTTIFSVMSALAAEYGAVNLGQGFPDFDCDPRLLELALESMQKGLNQYAPMSGVAALREAVSGKIEATYGRRYDPNDEITITAGATQAIMTAILCAVHPGDEVIVIEPVYDSYVPSIALAGGMPVRVQMEMSDDGFHVPWDKVGAAVSSRTRMIAINSPHNPTGSLLDEQDLQALAKIVDGTRILVLSDEVYEHIVYDSRIHQSVSRHDVLASRAFVISSFGKTFHVTGWKIGYVAAPAELTAEFRKVHQFNVFAVNTPLQYALAKYLQEPATYAGLPAFYQRKRDLFRSGLANTRFRALVCDGTYFQCVDYSCLSSMPEAEFARWLTTQTGVAAIPLAPFYQGGKESRLLRFCFAKKDETLQAALERLASI